MSREEFTGAQQWRIRMTAAVGLTVAVSCLAVASVGAGPLQAPGQLNVVRVDRNASDLHLVVSLPDALSGSTVPSSSFSVAANGTNLSFSSARLLDSNPTVTLVLTGSSDAALASAIKGAAREFILGLPSTVPIAISVGGSNVPASTDRSVALASVQAMPTSAPDLSQLHTDVRTALTAGGGIVVVLAQPAADGIGSPAFGAGPAEVSDPIVSVIQLSSTGQTDPALVALSSASGGDVISVASGDGLLHGFDTVERGLQERYWLIVASAPTSGVLTVDVTAAPGSTLVATTPLGAGSRATTPTPTRRSTGSMPTSATPQPSAVGAATGSSTSRWWDVMIGLIGFVLVGLGLWEARRRRPSRLTPAPTPARAPASASATRSGHAQIEPPRASVPDLRTLTPGLHALIEQLAEGAIARWADGRRSAGRSATSAKTLLVLEASASTWIDHPDLGFDDVINALGSTPDDTPEPIATVRGSIAGWLATSSLEPTLLDTALEAALIERESRHGRWSGTVARAMLATRPSRSGAAVGVPLLISPILTPQEEDGGLSTLSLDRHVEGLLRAVAAAADAMVAANFELARLEAWYVHQLADQHPSTQRMAQLICRRPVVDESQVMAAAGLTVDEVGRVVGELVARGWLTEVAPRAGVPRRWSANEVIKTLTASATEIDLRTLVPPSSTSDLKPEERHVSL